MMAALHVARPAPFEAMVPRWVPGRPRAWNLGSAFAEGGAAVALARRSTSRIGGWLAFATMLAVYPANVQAALEDGTPGIRGWAGTRQAAWLRLPLQLPLLWAALVVARRR